MRIHELQLTNFKGIRDLVLTLNGRDAKIRGDNAVGKTTLMDLFIWILTGKDHLGRADYQIKTLDEAGNAIQGIDHTGQAIVEHEGAMIQLTRTYREVWTKKNGSTEKTFTGHETEYLINNVPKSAKDYQAFIDRIVPAQLLKLLIMPSYFCEQLKAEDRRKMLLEICGNIDEEELISRPQFLDLAMHVSKFVSVADLKTQKTAEKKKINDALDKIPVKIDTHSKYLAPSGLTVAGEQTKIIKLTEAIISKTSERQALYNGEGISQLRRDLADLEAARTRAKTEAENRRNETRMQFRAKLAEAEDKISQIMVDSGRANTRELSIVDSYNRLLKDREAALAEYRALQSSEFSTDTVCPVCGQDIPEERLETAREQFNEDKSKKLEENIKNGKALAAAIEAKKKEHTEITRLIEKLGKELDEAYKLRDSIVSEMEGVLSEIVSHFDEGLIAAKQVEIDRFNESVASRAETLHHDIEFLESGKAVHEQNLSAIKNAEAAAAEIKKLRAEEKVLSGQFEDCERIISLCDAFTNAKVQMLDAKISGAFRIVTWKLTETQINGGLKEICDALIGGVPYLAANNAAQINAGLDIIEAFSQAYGVSLPIFIDNAESVTQLNPMDRGLDRPQIIQLIVPPKYEDVVPFPHEGTVEEQNAWREAQAIYDESNKTLRMEVL